LICRSGRSWAIQAGIRPEVIAFLRFRHELLNAFDRDANAFPSPRSWEFVSRIVGAAPDPSVEHELFAGAVGTGAATEFSAFLKTFRELPNIDAILMNPLKEPGTRERGGAIRSCFSVGALRERYEFRPHLQLPWAHANRIQRALCS
jgi:hypothetical protein